MKDYVLQRFKEVFQTKKISESQFAREIGVNQKTLNQQLRGERSLSVDTILSLLSSNEDISAEWLLRGEGEMLRSTVTQNNQNSDNIQGHSVNVNKAPEDRLLDIVRTQAAQLTKSQEQIDRLLGLLEKK